MYILASDFDGTLYYGDISDKNREAIKNFRAAGNKFGVVTGRDYWMYDTLVDENIEFDYIIALNGAMATDVNGNYIWCERIENKNGIVRAIAEYLDKSANTFLGCVYEKTRHIFCSDTFPFPMQVLLNKQMKLPYLPI